MANTVAIDLVHPLGAVVVSVLGVSTVFWHGSSLILFKLFFFVRFAFFSRFINYYYIRQMSDLPKFPVFPIPLQCYACTDYNCVSFYRLKMIQISLSHSSCSLLHRMFHCHLLSM